MSGNTSFLHSVPQGFHAAVDSLNRLPSSLISEMASRTCQYVMLAKGLGCHADEYLERCRSMGVDLRQIGFGLDARTMQTRFQNVINALLFIIRSAHLQSVPPADMPKQLRRFTQLSMEHIEAVCELYTVNYDLVQQLPNGQQRHHLVDIGRLLALDWKLSASLSSHCCENLSDATVTLMLTLGHGSGLQETTQHVLELSLQEFREMCDHFKHMEQMIDMLHSLLHRINTIGGTYAQGIVAIACYSSKHSGNSSTVGKRRMNATNERIRKLEQLMRSKTLILHKPTGYLSSKRRENEQMKTVYDLMRESLDGNHEGESGDDEVESYHMCGRLDADSSGLMIMSQNTDLVNHIIGHSRMEKEYRVEVIGLLQSDIEGGSAGSVLFTADEIAKFSRGQIQLRGERERCLPSQIWTFDDLTVVEEREQGKVLARQTCGIILREGRYRQVRRMMAAVGKRCVGLKRMRIGNVILDDLVPNEGECRFLSDEEVRKYLGYRKPLEGWRRELSKRNTRVQESSDKEKRPKWKRIE